MPSVKFLKGHSSNLSKNPLDNGTIYFTPDTRRLYIDTNSARVPITGDTMCGKIFWVCLPIGLWNAEDKKIQITDWYEKQNDTTSYDLTDVLSNDSIIFVGQTDKLGEYTYIICKNYSDGTMIFEYTGDNFEAITDDVWVQIYTPNPKIQSYIPLEDFPKSVYTAREYLLADPGWESTNDETGRHKYELIIDELNLETLPFMINISDDSLENINNYIDISDIEVEYKEENGWGQSTITFYSKEDFQFNIAIDLVVVIAKQGEWVGPLDILLFDNNNPITKEEFPTVDYEYEIFIPCQLNEIASGVKREFLAYMLSFQGIGDKYYSNIKNINYIGLENMLTTEMTYGILLTFSKPIDLTDNTSQFYLTIVQLNNISTINEVTLFANDSNWQSKEMNSSSTGEKETYYIQYAKIDSTTPLKISGKHLPLVYPVDVSYSQEFSKIIETKIFQNKIYFYAKELPTKNIKVKIIDFI